MTTMREAVLFALLVGWAAAQSMLCFVALRDSGLSNEAWAFYWFVTVASAAIAFLVFRRLFVLERQIAAERTEPVAPKGRTS